MFEAISRLFTQPVPPGLGSSPRLAVAALLVHLAAVDGATRPEERAAVEAALAAHYDLDAAEVAALVTEAAARDRDAVDFYRFTSALTALPEDERIEIIRMMWQIVFADGHNHELEDNMVWRIAELIGVSARQRTILRNRIGRPA